MFPKIQGLMNNFMVQPVDTVGARGARGVEGVGQNPFAGAVTGGENVYAQHDRGLEHGFGGAQYRDGAIIGRKLNFEC